MTFSLEQLTAFVTVYEKGSFSDAAIQLNKHRTTIGQVITNLEDQLAITLFERQGRSTIPTKDGDLLYRFAKLTVEQAKSFEKVSTSLAFGEFEEITIGYSSFIPVALLKKLRKNLADAFPLLRVNLRVMSANDAKQAIIEDRVQIGLVNADNRSAMTSLDATFLNTLSFSAYVGAGHELLDIPKTHRLESLRTHTQLVLESFFQDEASDKVIVSSNYEVISDMQLLLSILSEGIGWALIPVVVAKQAQQELELIELEFDQLKDDMRFPVALWFPHSKPIQNIKQVVVATIDDFIEQHRIIRTGTIPR
ncbi:LysR family transcriptional regulator [Paraferrimonas sedimenticola]|nr:LysR family transcriptional regulator [Paraferrimonas sedimenticola]